MAMVNDNRERVVLRGVIPGEVTVNVHAYRLRRQGECRVKVTLYRLRGADSTLLTRTLSLSHQGDEATAFRFTLDPTGELVDQNRLSKRFVGSAA